MKFKMIFYKKNNNDDIYKYLKCQENLISKKKIK